MATATARQTSNSPSQREESASGEMHACEDMMTYLRRYARENPENAALWCLGIGFVLGWKLKPW